jgi:hypothetical protein
LIDDKLKKDNMSNLFSIQGLIQKVEAAPIIPQTEDAATLLLADKVNVILKYAMGVGGAVAFILIIAGAFQIILSAGNPDRVKAGKEMITSAIAGLFLIIFSVLILRLIGVDILQIPDFK